MDVCRDEIINVLDRLLRSQNILPYDITPLDRWHLSGFEEWRHWSTNRIIVLRITRLLHDKIEPRLFKGKAILLFGPRQSGKSTLVESLLAGKDHMYLNGDDADVREILTNTTAAKT
ncbi:AAA family ATPase [Dyadobacter jejuensis]|uniref:AAA family ATPase n=1 Tax=Dyadobacter jejuensis TaxID=1082580 RepID=UPI0035B6A1B7